MGTSMHRVLNCGCVHRSHNAQTDLKLSNSSSFISNLLDQIPNLTQYRTFVKVPLRQRLHYTKRASSITILIPMNIAMDETALGKLSRAQLQKVAKVCVAFLVLNASH
jgi:hypothetical protein